MTELTTSEIVEECKLETIADVDKYSLVDDYVGNTYGSIQQR